jgi:hypothetical protein
MEKITSFQNEHRWLSNFAPCEIILDGIIFKSVEHAYMSAKSDSPEWKEFCRSIEKPGEVKKASRKTSLRHDWEDIKISVMRVCLEQKFAQEHFKTKLLATGNCIIEEGNFWGDTFWGVDLKTGKGLNLLGCLIMEIRASLS